MFFRKSLSSLILAVLILLIFLALFRFSGYLKSGFFAVGRPFVSVTMKVSSSLSGFGRFISNFKTIKEENKNLKKENDVLTARNIYMAELEKENEFLKKELRVIDSKKKFRFLMADVVAFDYFALDNSIVIDAGEEDGITDGMPVIVTPDILVGKISKTERSFSFVQLIFHPSGKVSAGTDKSSADGLVLGRFGYGLLMDMMPKEKKVAEGERVYTSGLDGIFPKNLLIGRISSVKDAGGQLFIQAEVKPAFDVRELNRVLIITNYLN